MKRGAVWIALSAIVLLALVAVFVWHARGEPEADGDASDAAARRIAGTPGTSAPGAGDLEFAADAGSLHGKNGLPDKEEMSTSSAEELRDLAEEKAVETFDALVDKWMDESKTGVSMADIVQFTRQFKELPKTRRGECLQRALNLVPDENVMVLLGVLMDKTVEREYVEQVFNDVLNRDEDVKKPILQQIFKDKTHACWADVAWILDATGELPKKGTNTVP